MAPKTVLIAAAAALGVVALFSFRSSQPLQAGVVSSRMRASMPSRSAACAKRESRRLDNAKKAAAGLALAGVSALAATMHTPPAMADVSGLTKCSQSPAFEKRKTKEIKSLQKQLAKTPEGTPGYLELKNRIDRTERREFVIPGLGFLYINGWIGWAGRKYIRGNRNEASKPTEGEIVLDVPRMSKAILSGGAWPFEAWKEYKQGDLTAKEADVTVSAK
eukprot:1393179-Amorphochlora_amoeboformis.AAC.1